MKQTEYIVLKLPERETRKRIRKATKIIYRIGSVICTLSIIAAAYLTTFLFLNGILELDAFLPNNSIQLWVASLIISALTYKGNEFLYDCLFDTKGKDERI